MVKIMVSRSIEQLSAPDKIVIGGVGIKMEGCMSGDGGLGRNASVLGKGA